jgi:HEXXH motif-containing protein
VYARSVIAAIQPPEDITLPRAGSTTARGILSRAIGRLLGGLRDVLRRPVGDEAVRRDVAAFASAIAAIPERQSALMSIVRRPNVGALLRCARLPDSDPALIRELIATIGVELAVLGALNRTLRLERPPARIVSMSGGFVVDLPEASALTIRPGAIEVGSTVVNLSDAREQTLGSLIVRRPYHPIAGSIALALEDNNPLSMYEAHPRKSGNRIDLGGREPSVWCDSLRDALDRIERYLPELRAEHDLFVQQFVPVGFDAEAHLSASYREAIGTIYLTLHPQPMTMTEAVIHEFSHNKINALFEIDDVLHNAYFPLYKSPVRPDPRPLHGVLLAVHAFVPVARLYEAMREANDPLAQHPSFESRFKQIVAGNHEGIEVLAEHAQPTAAGRAVLDELIRWDRHFA